MLPLCLAAAALLQSAWAAPASNTPISINHPCVSLAPQPQACGSYNHSCLADASRSCMAVCITGTTRSFWNERLQSSFVPHLGSFHGACADFFVVVERQAADAGPVRASWKDQPLEARLTPLIDFPLAISATHDRRRPSWVLQWDESDGDQRSKFMACLERLQEVEATHGRKYEFVLRTRPDALWYSALEPFVRLQDMHNIRAGIILTSHADTAWIGTRDTVVRHGFFPRGHGTGSAVADQGARFIGMPWAMCRVAGTVASIYSFLDLVGNPVPDDEAAIPQFAVTCYRIFALFGLRMSPNPMTWDDVLRDRKAVQAAFIKFKKDHTQAAVDLVAFDRLCSPLFNAIGTAPRIKHDLLLCSATSDAQLRLTFRSLLGSFRLWAAATVVPSRSDSHQTVAVAAVACEMLRALRFIAVAFGQTYPTPGGRLHHRSASAHAASLSTHNFTSPFLDLLSDNSPTSRPCTDLTVFDWYYWTEGFATTSAAWTSHPGHV